MTLPKVKSKTIDVKKIIKAAKVVRESIKEERIYLDERRFKNENNSYPQFCRLS